MAGKKKVVVKDTRNLTRRRDQPLNARQETFARLYAATGDAKSSLLEAGYVVKSDDAVRDARNRLLRHPLVMAIVDEVHTKMIEKHTMTAETVMLRFKLVYLQAMRCQDWGSAISALREVAKFYGLYEKHNAQKKYTQADVEKLKAELEAAGMDFTRVNFQPSTN